MLATGWVFPTAVAVCIHCIYCNGHIDHGTDRQTDGQTDKEMHQTDALYVLLRVTENSHPLSTMIKVIPHHTYPSATKTTKTVILSAHEVTASC